MDEQKILKFKGMWRTYQARVLKNADRYLADGKIHIVAAPGSGKTTLGIELIRRMGKRALVLAPSITIREQWVARIEEAFLCDGLDGGDYLSQSLKEPKMITVATYQALHSAMTQFCGAETADEAAGENTDEAAGENAGGQRTDAELAETVDYSGFQLIETMKAAGIGVLCLDECHHLRSEWWKALEEFKKQMRGVKTIALTATPPYDSTPAMWARYMAMCGEIDEEITIPELVKEGSLCPHQDYVYFNYPTEEEEREVEKFTGRSRAMFAELMGDAQLLGCVQSRRGLNGDLADSKLLDNPAYLSSILIYLQSKNVPFPGRLKSLSGGKRLPDMSAEWLERLLQGFLYDDADSFACGETYREQLIAKLKAQGLIEKRKVTLTKSAAVEKLLMTSAGKCESIKDITFYEYETAGANLRLLILTDYIRREYEKNIGGAEDVTAALGVLPFFEMLRRENAVRNASLRLGVLCGSIVVIPAEARDALMQEIGDDGKVTFSGVGNLPETDYLKVTAVGDAHFLTGAITNIFSKGYFQTLIGTKSLLGEGWDSPCINALILASFVGSFMLSNQMRGRAIRVFKEQPKKTSNIWHLVCLNPESGLQGGSRGEKDIASEDFALLERRMEHFLGLHYTEDTIENGMERLSIIHAPFTRENAQSMNREMLKLSGQRETLRERWNRALTAYEKTEIADETEVDERRVTAAAYRGAVKSAAVSAAAAAAMLAGSLAGGAAAAACPALFCLSAAWLASSLRKAHIFGNPQKRLKAVGNGIYTTLRKQGLMESGRAKVVAETLPAQKNAVYLKGVSGRDKALFSQCAYEFFAPINDQRYILMREGGGNGQNDFYPVPECFAKKKEDAELFAACMKPYIGKYAPVYTRSEAGRKILLEGRIRALADGGEGFASRKKKVKGSFQNLIIKKSKNCKKGLK